MMLATTNITVGEHFASFKIFGVTIYGATVYGTLIAGAIVIAFGLFARRHATSGVPGRIQLTLESIIDAIQRQVGQSIGPNGARIVPLAFTLFVFILICNWLEFLPTGTQPSHLGAPTGDVNLTYAMAIFVFILFEAAAIKTHGVRGYTRRFFTPYKILFPINVIEELAKPVTLSLRLFGNVFSGAIMLILISSLFPPYVSWLPNIVWKLFDVGLIGLIQAFIFALLTILYFESAMSREAH
jgi:F-type H+-transporting ATPase subunit a